MSCHLPSTLTICTYLACCLTACDNAGGWRQSPLPVTLIENVHGNRRIEPRPSLDVLRPRIEYRLPASVGHLYKLSMPTALALDANSCTLAVADVIDRAVHLFRLDGAYRVSLYGGGRGEPVFGLSGLSSLSVQSPNLFVVSTMSGAFIGFDSTGAITHTAHVPRGQRFPLGNDVLVGSDGLIYDHWLAGRETTLTLADWSRERGLVRIWSPKGELVGRFGLVQQFPGEGLTHYLNRGIVAISDDTLWLARRSDARILGFPLRPPGPSPARVIDVPVFYKAALPVEYVRSEPFEIAIRMQEHLRAFTIGPDGSFYMIQSLSWPDPTDTRATFMPQTMVTVVGRDGRLHAALGSDAGLGTLAVAADIIVATTSRAGKVTVVALENPLPARSAAMRSNTGSAC